nr:hypothetical protein BgiMline_010006 [Biomphalaria glabrata]
MAGRWSSLSITKAIEKNILVSEERLCVAGTECALRMTSRRGNVRFRWLVPGRQGCLCRDSQSPVPVITSDTILSTDQISQIVADITDCMAPHLPPLSTHSTNQVHEAALWILEAR